MLLSKVQRKYAASVISSTKGHTGIIALNGSKGLNALNEQLVSELLVELKSLENQKHVRAILIKGSERAFSGRSFRR